MIRFQVTWPPWHRPSWVTHRKPSVHRPRRPSREHIQIVLGPGLVLPGVVAGAAAEAWRLVPAPLAARRHGSTPSISVSSEKLRNVLISTSSPRTSTLSNVGETTTVLTRSAAT